MLVKISKEIFKEDNFGDLKTLLQFLTWKGRYEIFVDLPSVINSGLYGRLDSADKSIIESHFNKFVTESGQPDFCVSESEDDAFNFEEAIRFLNQPVTVVLENSLNDGHFVRAIIKHFDKKEILTKHLKNSWISFGNAGGKNNFVNFLSAELKTFRNLPKENYRYLRSFVIIDSDKKFPGMEPESDKVIEFLKENKIPFHILEKREMENYLPDEAIDAIRDNREFIDAYLRLNPIQKDYFDLEKGFDKKTSSNCQTVLKNCTEELMKIIKRFSEQGI